MGGNWVALAGDRGPSRVAVVGGLVYVLFMSTLTLEKLPESVETLTALIRSGATVRLTDKGRVVATVAPKAKPAARRRKPKLSVAEFIEKYLDPLPVRNGLDATAFLRTERDRE